MATLPPPLSPPHSGDCFLVVNMHELSSSHTRLFLVPLARSLPLESSLSQLLALSIIVWHCTHHTILHQSLMQPHSTIQHVLLPFLEAPAPKVQLMEVEGGIWTIFDYYSHGRPDSG